MIKPNRTSVSCEKIILWRKHFFASFEEVNPVQVVLRGKKGMLYILWIRIFFLDYSVRFDFRIIMLFMFLSIFFIIFLMYVYVYVCIYVRSKRATTCSQIQSINFEWFRLFRVSVYRFNLFEMPFNHSQSAFDVNYWRELFRQSSAKDKSNFIEKVMIIFCLTYANLSHE